MGHEFGSCHSVHTRVDKFANVKLLGEGGGKGGKGGWGAVDTPFPAPRQQANVRLNCSSRLKLFQTVGGLILSNRPTRQPWHGFHEPLLGGSWLEGPQVGLNNLLNTPLPCNPQGHEHWTAPGKEGCAEERFAMHSAVLAGCPILGPLHRGHWLGSIPETF
eukprot:1160173-Pelagomonas_calceolata.AAC.4